MLLNGRMDPLIKSCMEKAVIKMNDFESFTMKQIWVQLALEQHGFELHRSTYTWIFFYKYIENLEICKNLEKLLMNYVA